MREVKTPVRRLLESVEEKRLQVGRMRRNVRMMQDKCRCSSGRRDYPSGGQRGRGDLLDTLLERKEELLQEEQKLHQLEKKVEGWIELLPQARWRTVLRYRYLDGMDLPEVAQEMSKSAGREFTMAQVYHFHHGALKAAEKIWPLD